MSENEGNELLEEEGTNAEQSNALPSILWQLNSTLSTMATSMRTMEHSLKRWTPRPNSEDNIPQKRKKSGERATQHHGTREDLDSDVEQLLNSSKTPANSDIEGVTDAPSARLKQDALLSEISQHFAQEDDKRPDINQQLADIVNKRWSSKLNEAKLKQNLEEYTSGRRTVKGCVNAEIWEKIDQKARQQDLRACAIQKKISAPSEHNRQKVSFR